MSRFQIVSLTVWIYSLSWGKLEDARVEEKLMSLIMYVLGSAPFETTKYNIELAFGHAGWELRQVV